MKKIFLIVLSFTLILSISGCGGLAGQLSNVLESALDEVKNEMSEEIDPDKILGTTNLKTYTNSYIGIGCTIPSDWNFYSPSQLLELNELSQTLVGDEYKQQLVDKSVFFDMCAVSSDGLTNMNITLERSASITIQALNMESHYRSLAQILTAQLVTQGATDISYEFYTYNVGGQTLYGTTLTMQLNGMTAYMTSVTFKCENHLAVLTTTSYNENRTEQIHNYFFEA